MSFKTAQGVLAAALATSGTFTIAYPTGYSKGDFVQSAGHKIVFGGNDKYKAPDDFTLSFGANATGITLTWNNATTIAAGRRWTIQMEMQGQNDGRPVNPTDPRKMVELKTWRVNLGSPATADADGIAESQSIAAAASAVLNGALADPYGNVYAQFDVPRNVVGAWTTASVITFNGVDEFGIPMQEKSASGTSHTGKKAFKKVTSISSSASITSATFGTGVVFGLPVFLPHLNNVMGEYQDGVRLASQGGNIVTLEGLALEAAVDAGTGLNFVSPVAGVIRKLSVISQGTITTGGAVTLEVNTVAVNGLSVTIVDADAEGQVRSDTPTYGHATTAVAVGDRLEVQFAAAINASADLYIVIEIEANEATHGTFVVGLSGAAGSATSNDVRGTYAPAATPNGDIGFMVDLALADPSYRGEAQFDG